MMEEGVAKLFSMTLCVLIIADISALASVNLQMDESPSSLTGSPKMIWVDDDFIDDPPNHKWDTIQEGVDDANGGDTVYVFNGTYYEDVDIHKTINLTGEDRKSTVIESSGGLGVEVFADWVNITGFTMTNGTFGAGIVLFFAENCYIADNILSYNDDGIGLHLSNFTTIANNYVIANNNTGIALGGSNNTVISNTVSWNRWNGIHSRRSSNNTIVNNKLVENGIFIFGSSIDHWNTHTIDTSNTVDGRPVYYWKNAVGGTVPPGAGQVILANSTGVVVENQNVSNGTAGIQLGFSSNNIIANNTGFSNNVWGVFVIYSSGNIILNNTLMHNGDGIAVYYSDNNTIVHNNASLNNWDGIWLDNSNDNAVLDNNASSNDMAGIRVYSSNSNILTRNYVYSNNVDGFGLHSADNNIITDNNIISNKDEGLRLSMSSYNMIYHNNIVDNVYQANDDYPAQNDWHHPLLLEGNYWSDYTGLDDGSGTGKHAIAGDGVGDTLIPHPGADYDFYPFMRENGWIVPENNPPVADAGPDQTVYVGDVVQFDGSGSYDPDNGWQTTTVDSAGRVGSYTSLALDRNDNPHIGYYDWTNDALKYSKWNGTAWNIEIVDKHGGRWANSITLDNRGYPHIAYRNYANDEIRYAKWNGSAWIIDIVDSNGFGPSLALDSNGNPHITYKVGNPQQDLRYAKWSGNSWIIQTVDSVGNVGGYSSLALDSNDYPHISYQLWFGVNNGHLKYAKWNGIVWEIEDVVNTFYFWRGWTSLALDSNDYPHISYSEGVNYPEAYLNIRYAQWNGTAWNFETVVSGDRTRDRTSIVLDSNGHPHISYSEVIEDRAAIKYAKRTGNNWDIEDVDINDFDINRRDVSPSLALDSNDDPHISYSDWVKHDLKYAKKGDYIVSYEWDFGDGSPHGFGVKTTHVYTSPGIYNVTITVTDKHGATDTDNCIITVLPRNQPPVADANGPYYVDEGSPLTLDGSDSYDPDGDILQYRWDLNNDGVWDTGWSSSPYVEYTWGDDLSGNVVLQVSDGEFTDTDTAAITVRNVAPTVELRMLPIYMNVSLRIAGEKWHDVSIELYEDGVLIAEGSLTRYPGSPNNQMLDLAHLSMNISRKYSAKVRYTPEDDPVNGQPNGANPCWIILRFDDQEEVRIHHTFNVQHPERYIWEVDLTRAILLHGLTFEANAYDPGADDLTFRWDLGEGTNVTNFYPNLNGTFPVEIIGTITHAFTGSGTFRVTLTVEDDDGGIGTASVTIDILP